MFRFLRWLPGHFRAEAPANWERLGRWARNQKRFRFFGVPVYTQQDVALIESRTRPAYVTHPSVGRAGPTMNDHLVVWRALKADREMALLCLRARVSDEEILGHFDGTRRLDAEGLRLLAGLA